MNPWDIPSDLPVWKQTPSFGEHRSESAKVRARVASAVWNGYGSIPIDTFLVGWTSIYQLFWGSLGTRVLTHTQIFWNIQSSFASLRVRKRGWVSRSTTWNVAVAADCSGSDSDQLLLIFRSSGNGRTIAWPCFFLPFGREACLFGWFWVAKARRVRSSKKEKFRLNRRCTWGSISCEHTDLSTELTSRSSKCFPFCGSSTFAERRSA